MPDAELPGSEPILKEIGDLATALQIAKPSNHQSEPGGAGAVFLIGAGCSVSAGIRHAAGVAQYCAVKLAHKLSGGQIEMQDAERALAWLVAEKKVNLPLTRTQSSDGSHWGKLYNYFFEAHFQSANMQREIINAIVDEGGNKLNWAHACLGELVSLGYARTVLTTNFDQLVLQGITRTGDMPVIADGLEALNRIVGRPKRPQVVHLHGSMHTYDLRNSHEAIAETGRHSVAQTMVHSLMQECDLLVVVGYSGGEEGIMTLLKDAGNVRRKLVVYWVMYSQGVDNLSVNARALLTGENKFVVWGGSADRFFGQLMSEMKLGQPRWVRDPIGVFKQQSELLIAPPEEQPEVRILVEAFKARVDFADRPEHRLNEQDGRKVQAAAARAQGDFATAYRILEDADRVGDAEAARLHALNALSLCETVRNDDMLQATIKELESLLKHTDGQTRLESCLSLGQALLLLSEYAAQDDSGSQAARAPLEKIERVVEEALPLFPSTEFQLGNARLNLLKAQALQSQGERDPIVVEKLLAGRDAYGEAIVGLQAARDAGGLLLEAKAGLAALVQVLGEARKDLALLHEAVERHREVVGLALPTERSLEDAGPTSNLVGSLMSLAAAQSSGDQVRSYQEARDLLVHLEAAHEQEGDTEAACDTRRAIDTIDLKLASLQALSDSQGATIAAIGEVPERSQSRA